MAATCALLALCFSFANAAQASPDRWRYAWPKTDFSKTSIDFDEIMSGGPPKDGIPSIDAPRFVPVAESSDLAATEPVIGLVVAGDARAYPLRILIRHEIVNDTVGGIPVAVTYCPLCNSAVVFDRRVAGEATEFGTTGKLRNSDLVMYDRATESWWQQFLGEAIVGARTGTRLKVLPARLESWERFAQRFPDGRVLVPRLHFGTPMAPIPTSATTPLAGRFSISAIFPITFQPWPAWWRSGIRPGRSSYCARRAASNRATWC